jgi:predicted nucleotide-binding protein (sugar kinase/HSP70/actin superfamily)
MYRGFRREALAVRGSAAMRRLLDGAGRALDGIPLREDARPLRVGVVGEIYGTIDPFTNLELESRLCAMGVEVERCVTISDWLVEHMIKGALHLPRDLRFARAARPYLGADIGGHTRETLGHTVLHALDGFDGVIQLYPLGCMPEIVAQCILPRIIEDYRIPVLTLIVDEMTGETGYMTRVEAFLDLLVQRRRARPAYLEDVWAECAPEERKGEGAACDAVLFRG